MTKPKIPEGFVKVSRPEFFKLLDEAAAVDPMPTTNHPEYTTWETLKGPRIVWGWSYPGWRNSGEGPKAYAVKKNNPQTKES